MFKSIFIIFLSSLVISSAAVAGPACNEGDTPKQIQKLENWDIIATNTASIPTAEAFSGPHLSYSVSAHPTNRHNKIRIHPKTGKITIKAERKDDFDVSVMAKNHCGKATVTFNVTISQEE